MNRDSTVQSLQKVANVKLFWQNKKQSKTWTKFQNLRTTQIISKFHHHWCKTVIISCSILQKPKQIKWSYRWQRQNTLVWYIEQEILLFHQILASKFNIPHLSLLKNKLMNLNLMSLLVNVFNRTAHRKKGICRAKN